MGVRVDISVVHEVDGSIVWRYGGPYDAVPGVPGVLSTVLGGSTHRESPAHRSHRSGRSGAAQRAAKRVFVSSSQTIMGPYGTSRAENNWACRQKKKRDDLTDGTAGQDRWHGRSGWLGLVRADGMAGWEAGQGRWPGWHGWMELARPGWHADARPGCAKSHGWMRDWPRQGPAGLTKLMLKLPPS